MNQRQKHRRMLALLLAGIVAVVGGLTLVFLHAAKSTPQSGTQGATTNPSAPGPASSRVWIMAAKVLNEMTSDPAARSAIAPDTIYVIVGASSWLSPTTQGLHLVRTADFTSEARMAQAFAGNSLSPGVQAILYDNETWSLTPADEQANPVTYYQQASGLAHSRGMLLIATPVPSRSDPSIAPFADVLDIQAQEVQASPQAYSAHVLPIAQAVLSANPKIIVVAGLSTNPRAGLPTPAQLVADASSVAGTAKGFWLNVPETPAGCSPAIAASDARCFGPQPQLGIQFLASLGAA